MKVAFSRSGLLATALVSKAALLRRPSRSHTRTSLVRSLLVAQKEEQKAGLAPHRVLLKATLKKWLLPFFLNASPLPYNRKTLRPHVRVRPPFSSSQHFPMSPLRGDVMICTRMKNLRGGARAAVKKLHKKI